MNVIVHTPWYTPSKPSIDEAVAAKMKVLKEFYIVDDKNRETIEKQLREAIAAQPDKDYELILDRVAHVFIERKLNSL